MMRELLVWLQTRLGKGDGEFDQSWSEALLGSLNFWGILEGTHVLALMLFAGTIMIVDLRLLGVTFRRTAISVLGAKVLPLTVFGFAIMVLTGLALFYARPVDYYHNIWFRAKLVFIALALLNIIIFHVRVQRNQAAWDLAPKPPPAARVSAIVSLAAWIAVIAMGRFMAYDWFECGKPMPAYLNALQSCAASEAGALNLASVRP